MEFEEMEVGKYGSRLLINSQRFWREQIFFLLSSVCLECSWVSLGFLTKSRFQQNRIWTMSQIYNHGVDYITGNKQKDLVSTSCDKVLYLQLQLSKVKLLSDYYLCALLIIVSKAKYEA